MVPPDVVVNRIEVKAAERSRNGEEREHVDERQARLGVPGDPLIVEKAQEEMPREFDEMGLAIAERPPQQPIDGSERHHSVAPQHKPGARGAPAQFQSRRSRRSVRH